MEKEKIAKLKEALKNFDASKVDPGAFRKMELGNYRDNIAHGAKRPDITHEELMEIKRNETNRT